MELVMKIPESINSVMCLTQIPRLSSVYQDEELDVSFISTEGESVRLSPISWYCYGNTIEYSDDRTKAPHRYLKIYLTRQMLKMITDPEGIIELTAVVVDGVRYHRVGIFQFPKSESVFSLLYGHVLVVDML